MACVSKRRGKWVIDYRDQHGIRRWETVEGTRKDADERLARLIQEIGHNEYQPRQEHKTFNELVDAYTKAHIQVNVRATTCRDYENRIKRHLLPYFINVKIRLITPQMIEAFRAKLVNQNVGRRTINKCLILMGSMFRYSIKHKWMTYNPAAEVKKLKEDISHKEDLLEDNVLKPDEIRLLLSVFDSSDERWRMIIMTAILSGLRQGELLGLQWGDIDWNTKQVYVRRTLTEGRFYDPKTKYSRRKVDIPDILVSELKRWKLRCPKGELDLVFSNGAGNPENNGNLLRRGFYPALRRAKLRHVRFHDLRHTYASLLIANGEHPKYIQSQLGHSSIQVTMDVYGHLMKATNNLAAEKLATLALGSNMVASGSKMVANAECEEMKVAVNSDNYLKSLDSNWWRCRESNPGQEAYETSALAD